MKEVFIPSILMLHLEFFVFSFLAYPTSPNLHNAPVGSPENRHKDGPSGHPYIPKLSAKPYKPGRGFLLKISLLNKLIFVCSV